MIKCLYRLHYRLVKILYFDIIPRDQSRLEESTEFIDAYEINSLANSPRTLQRLYSLRLSRRILQKPEVTLQNSRHEYYFRMITFQCNYLLAADFGFYGEARHVGILVSRSKRTFRKRKFPAADNRATSHTTSRI